MKMICLEDGFEYPQGTKHKKNKEFEVEEAHVQVLTVTGKAHPAEHHEEFPTKEMKDAEEKDLTAGADYKTRAIIHAPGRKRQAA